MNVTALSLDAASAWTVTGDSRIARLSIAPGATVYAPGPVTVTFGGLAEGTELPAAANVTFIQDPAVVDDFEQKKMGPPPGGMPGGPGEGSGGPGGPGMPVPPMG